MRPAPLIGGKVKGKIIDLLPIENQQRVFRKLLVAGGDLAKRRQIGKIVGQKH